MRVINNLQSDAIGNKGEEKKNKTEHIRNESILNEEKDRRPRANTFAGVPSNAQSPLERTSLATPVKFIRFRFFVPPTCPIRSTEVIQTSDNERVTTHNGHLYQKFDTPDQNIQDDEPESRTMLVPSQKVKDQDKILLTFFVANGSSILKKCQLNVGTEEKSSAATSSANFSEQSSLSKSDKKVEFLITEEKFRSRSSSVSGGSNISIKRDNGLNCKIETKHSPASLPGTSSMQSLLSSTNEEFVEPNEVGVGRRQLNLANGDNKMPSIEKPKVSPDSDQDQRKNKNRPLAPKYLSKKICKYFMLLLLSMIFICSIAVYISESQDRKHSSDYASAVAVLKKRIYGQDSAIDQLSKYLPLDTPRSNIIVLVCGTDVDISYMVESIKVPFPRQYAIHWYSASIRKWSELVVNPFIDADLIVMDKLKERDLIDIVDFLKRHQDTYKGRFATVLAVFNLEHIDDHSLRGTNSWRSVNAIRDAFLNKNINVEIIHYNSFVEDAFVQEIEKMQKASLTEE